MRTAERPELRALLESLLAGDEALPSARERWTRLLNDPSPEIRLEAERVLLDSLLRLPEASPEGARPMDPRLAGLPPFAFPADFEPSEPWRFCRICWGSEFWVDESHVAHCRHCWPPARVHASSWPC